MFKKMKLGTRIWLGFGSLILIVGGIAALAWVNLDRVNAEAQIIAVDCLPGTAMAGKIEAGVRAYYVTVLQHLIADETADMAEHRGQAEAHMAAIQDALKKYEGMITLAEDRQLFAKLSEAIKPFESHSEEVMAFSDQGKKDEAEAALEKSETDAEAAVAAAQAISEFNSRNGAEAGKRITGILSAARLALTLGSVIAVGLGLALAFFITRGITRPVNRMIQSLTDGANQVTDASRQVASASQQLAAGASQQASSLEETSSALEQMAAMTRTNAANAEKANELAGQARKSADQGEQTMGELNTAMTAINESAAQIGKIIKVIEEIAFQTNLLALNAAVEAARAGEMGKGFAVVAEEVRNLAQRSAQAARDTTNLIEGAVTRAKQGTTVATNAGKSLSSIVADVANVAELLAGISKASGEQAQGVDQINTAVSQMDKVTQQNAAGAEESASAAEQLSAQAQTLKQVVDELTVLVRGATGDSSASGSSSQGTRPRANRSAASAARTAPARAAASQAAHTPAAHDDFNFGQDFAAGSNDTDANLKQF